MFESLFLSGMSVATIMIIVWSVVIAVSLLIEVLTYDLVTIFFIPAGLICLILAATSVIWWVHIIVFVVLAIAGVATLRPVLKRLLIKPTVATEITQTTVGQKLRLLEDVVDGKSLIRINGVEWTAVVEGCTGLKKDAMVEVVRSESNKFIVVPADDECPEEKGGK